MLAMCEGSVSRAQMHARCMQDIHLQGGLLAATIVRGFVTMATPRSQSKDVSSAFKLETHSTPQESSVLHNFCTSRNQQTLKDMDRAIK
mmetsp:Transcript_36054/g.52932  ORF Transcript_36054/g.52932 Transcript_36054/m.52932 type:complete len:89 (+) Transcript_36054:481-747(+)